MLRKVIASSLVVSVSWATWVMAAPLPRQGLQDELSHQRVMERLDRFMGLVEELRTHIDRSQFDLEALLDKLDYDPERVIRFVTGEIHFEQYQGLLRGAQGTLMSRAGNALDQAVLLASLLKNAGFDARVVHGNLQDGGAARLVAQMTVARRPEPPPLDWRGLKETLEKMALEAGLDADRVRAALAPLVHPPSVDPPVSFSDLEFFERSHAEAQEIVDLLKEAGISVGANESGHELIAEARDYFWLEWKRGPASSWQPIHPAFTDRKHWPTDLEAIEVFRDRVPAELQHRFRLESIVEQQLGKRTKTHQLMEPWERPVANLVGRTMTYVNLPDRLTSREGFDDPTASIRDSTYFIPLLNGGLPKAVVAFDMDGNVVPPDALVGGYAGLFKELSGKAAKALSSLAGLGDSQADVADADVVRLASHHIDFVFIAPDGRETRVRRTVFDEAYSGVSGESESVKRRLSEELSFMIAAGRYPAAYVTDQALQRTLDGRGVLELAVDHAFLPEREVRISKAKGGQLSWGYHMELLSLFDAGIASEPATLSYRAQPSLIAHRRELRIGDDVRAVVDIVRNVRRTYRGRASDLVADPVAAIHAGVWETWAESAVPTGAGEVLATAANLIERAREQGVPIRVLKPAEADLVDEIELPADSRQAIERDLRSGYHVVAPIRPLSESKDWGLWYRVNITSGETLGMIGSGMGATATEYVIVLIAVTIGVYVALRVYEDCAGTPLGAQAPAGSTAKNLGCALCAAVAGVTAGLLAYSAGIWIAEKWAETALVASLPAFPGGSAGAAASQGLVYRLSLMAHWMRTLGFSAETIASALTNFIVQVLCTEVSLA